MKIVKGGSMELKLNGGSKESELIVDSWEGQLEG